ncbi:MAG: hypothetical protein J6V72_20615 [Kiritimatiellae bacterium]|nr:hypothetical protein [Kiritimatiellia bacterium]
MKTTKPHNHLTTKPQAAVAQPANIDESTAQQLLEQYKVVISAEAASFRERVKFGAMLILWEQFLGESRGGKGGTADGTGLKGWLEKHCPEIGYSVARSYKESAHKAAAMLGGGARAVAALLGEATVTTPAKETVTIDAEVIEKRDSLFEDATSRRKLEQMYFSFMEQEERKERAKNRAVAPLPKLKPSDEAAAIWTKVMGVIDKTAVKDAIPLLTPKAAGVCYARLSELAKAMKEQMGS